MPWCQKCGAEYLEGVEVCSTCNLPLKSAPTLQESADDESEWVILEKVPNLQLAEIVHDLLFASGIPSMVRDRDGALKDLYGDMAFLDKGVEIFVHISRLDEAKELIAGQIEWTDDELIDYMERTGDLDDELAKEN